MSTTKYPFRFYGREPADWTPSPHGFLYDLQFAAPLDEAARESVHALAERHFGRGPAMLGDVWHWGGDRFLVVSVVERFPDAARMVFTHVAEFLSIVQQSFALRDAVFCNGIGARADRWDAWSVKQSAEPDAGPARPDAPWAALLRRPVDQALQWSASAARAHAPAAPVAKPVGAKKYSLTPCDDPSAALDDPALAGWRRIVARFDGDSLERVTGARVPLGWVQANGRRVALVCLDGEGNPRRIEMPTGNPDAVSTFVAVDPDGLHAVTHVGQQIYSVDLAQGTVRWRVTIHDNNGAVGNIAWVVDDLWAVRCVSQLLLFDLSEKDAVFVGTQQPNGSMIGSFRHGTVLAVQGGARLTLIGVCDWQIKKLTQVSTGWRAARIVDDGLYLGEGAATERVDVDAVYEAWAAGLRKRAERCRVKRFKPPKKGVRWQWIESAAMPPEPLTARRDALTAQYGETSSADLHESGDAVVVTARPKSVVSRSAEFRWCPVEGKHRVLKSVDAAREKGVTNFSMDPAREAFFFIAGSQFTVHRVSIARDETEQCPVPGFDTRVGILYNIVALTRRDMVAVWNDTLDWHREAPQQWTVQVKIPLDLPRGVNFDHASRRMAVTQQSRDKLLVFAVGPDGLTELARCLDGVKLASFREGRLFAQMIDGQWFELLGADAASAT